MELVSVHGVLWDRYKGTKKLGMTLKKLLQFFHARLLLVTVNTTAFVSYSEAFAVGPQRFLRSQWTTKRSYRL